MFQLFDENKIPTPTFLEAVKVESTNNELYYPRITGGILDGTSYRSNVNGARLEIFPDSEPTVGLQLLNSAGSNTFKALISGDNSGDIEIGDYSSDQGIFWDDSVKELYVEGNITVTGDITSSNYSGVSPYAGYFLDYSTGDLFANNITARGAIITGSGSTINGTYIDSLSVGKLSAGTITSKAITLAADSTDCYINSGKTDFTNTNAGFILGRDYSDSNTAKLYFGDSDKYINWDGTNLNATGINIERKFTAGEDLASGDVVCMIPDIDVTIISTKSTYVNNGSSSTNYGSAEYLHTDQYGAGYNRISLIDFSMTTVPAQEQILKAYIYLTVKTTANLGGVGTLVFNNITSAWDESTVTFNTKPTNDTDYTSTMTLPANPVPGTAYAVDVTNWLRAVKFGNITNYGLLTGIINSLNVPSDFQWHSDDQASEALRPYLVVYSTNDTDGKIYKAKTSDYFYCRNIIGVTKEAINTDATGIVTISGISDTLHSGNSGNSLYLSATSGNVVNNLTNAERAIMIGKKISETETLLDIQKLDIPIETQEDIPVTTAIYTLTEARWALMEVDITGGNHPTKMVVRIERGTESINTFTIGVPGAISWSTFTATWSGNSITTSQSGASTATVNKITFFT